MVALSRLVLQHREIERPARKPRVIGSFGALFFACLEASYLSGPSEPLKFTVPRD
jgi:hypothetical protein